MRKLAVLILALSILCSWSQSKIQTKGNFVIANGQMPHLVIDEKGNLQLVYGAGDSIMYAYSSNGGQTFSAPLLISILPELAASHTRGPQIAATKKGLTVLASNSVGDIFSFSKTGSGQWQKGGKVNDTDTTAKENLMALSGDGENAFAVWLDLRENKHNKIYGARSDDGGKSWSKNILIYASPDSTVCECCKPSVVVKGSNVYVMFRNWLQGNRDMYLVKSSDSGKTFGKASRLGNGSWKLNGCPMDGGGLAVKANGEINTVWRREGKVYAAIPGMPEQEIGTGKGSTLASVNGKRVYAWTEQGNIIILTPQGEKKVIGKGSQPVLQALNNEHVICVWEHDHQIHASVLEI
jgi:hypothetical protein